MSAFVVDKRHIDALVAAGVASGTGRMEGSRLRWIWPAVSDEDREHAYARGEAWGPEAVRLYTERAHELRYEDADRVGAMLWSENVRSVGHRYDSEDDLPGPIEFSVMDVASYTFPASLPPRGGWSEDGPSMVLAPVQVLKALDCYEYQSCEHPGWEASEAHAFCESLRRQMIHLLPGYEEADWAI